jgi:hypothetical protein
LLLKNAPSVIHYYLREFIFPQYMRYQVRICLLSTCTVTPLLTMCACAFEHDDETRQRVKLSASGQDLGGSMLFGRRIGCVLIAIVVIVVAIIIVVVQRFCVSTLIYINLLWVCVL